MDTTTQAHIHLADQRGHSQTTAFRSFHSFNFGTYRAEGREPFGALCLLNDDSLRAGASLSLQVEEDTHLLLLPVTGGLEYRCDPETVASVSAGTPAAGGFLVPGQAGLFPLMAGIRYTVSNPYAQETINFLQLWFTRSGSAGTGSGRVRSGRVRSGRVRSGRVRSGRVRSGRVIDINLSPANTLSPLVGRPTEPGPRVFMGQFEGRQDNVFTGRPEDEGVYVFVLQGAFEVANRLLHEKDGLALRNLQDNQLAFEALSNGAILLILTV